MRVIWGHSNVVLHPYFVLTLKVSPLCGNVGDNVGDVAKHGGEGDEADEELEYHTSHIISHITYLEYHLEYHIYELTFGVGVRQVPDGRHGLYRPVETNEVEHGYVFLFHVLQTGPILDTGQHTVETVEQNGNWNFHFFLI